MNVISNSVPEASHEVAVLWDVEQDDDDPGSPDIEGWAKVVLNFQQVAPCEVAIKVLGETESRTLNEAYRGKDNATNVLSFPLDAGQVEGPLLLGDLALCADVIRAEASEQGKTVDAHFAHMVVHGVLHLLGYDHVEQNQAEEMEQIERDILHTMGFSDPYRDVG